MRTHRTTNPRAVAAWVTGSCAALAAVLLARQPALFLWGIGIALVAAVLGLGMVAAEARAERDDALAKAERLALFLAERDDELAHADQLITRLAGEAAAHAETVPVPLIRPGKGTRLFAVPPQRDGSEYEWPALAREIEHDELGAIMRATEEK